MTDDHLRTVPADIIAPRAVPGCDCEPNALGIVTREHARWDFRTLPKYEREFITEDEVKERRALLLREYDPEGYGTRVGIYRIDAARWLLLAWWGSCE